MKKFFLGLAALFLTFGAVQAQDPAKSLKAAGKSLSTFNLDQTNNKADLQAAVDAIAIAETGEETKGLAKTWLVKGEIYNAVASQIVQIKQLGFGELSEVPSVDDPAYNAAIAFEKAADLAEKKYETKDATKGLQAVQSNLYNMGIYAYDEKDFDKAYRNFKEMITIHEKLKGMNQESSLDDPTALQDQKYITGLAAISAEKQMEAKPLFEELAQAGYDKAGIYEALYQIKAVDDVDAAYKYLEDGRQKYPDDVSLLFAEINHFLKVDRLGDLIDKLKQAIAKEPDNVSLYSTLGNVYDNLYQRANESTDEAEKVKAKEYFNNSLDYYNQALAKKPDYFDAIYSIGALHFNRAAGMTAELNVLADDLSRDGQKKYDALKVEINKVFEEALPFFKKAEKMNPNDINTLIALKEIFARQNDFDTSNKFKQRLETVQSGGSNETSFFNE